MWKLLAIQASMSQLLTKVEPHGPDFKSSLTSHVFVLGNDLVSFGGGEVLQLKRFLYEEGNGTMEEVGP